jgi:plastocyanin
LAIGLASQVNARDLTVVITDNSGKPIEDAVVILDAPGAPKPAPRRFVINQKDMQFAPQVLVIPAGSTVEFGNLDPLRHHVYSFSPARRFELKLFGQGETRPVRFDNAGVVSIGCNIHDQMQAFLQVVDTPHAAKSGANGQVVLRDVPSGSFKVRVWHSRLRAPGNQLTLDVNTASTTRLPVKIRLRRSAPMQHDY